MSPVLASLLAEVGCAPSPKTSDRERLSHIVACCSQVVGFIHVNGITPSVPLYGREIAELAEQTLPTHLSAGFAPLAHLDQVLADHPLWSFIDLSAHISSIARDAVQRSSV